MSLATLLLIFIAAFIGFVMGEVHGSKHLKVTSLVCGLLILICFFFTSLF